MTAPISLLDVLAASRGDPEAQLKLARSTLSHPGQFRDLGRPAEMDEHFWHIW
jgi:hypothetical protein